MLRAVYLYQRQTPSHTLHGCNPALRDQGCSRALAGFVYPEYEGDAKREARERVIRLELESWTQTRALSHDLSSVPFNAVGLWYPHALCDHARDGSILLWMWHDAIAQCVMAGGVGPGLARSSTWNRRMGRTRLFMCATRHPPRIPSLPFSPSIPSRQEKSPLKRKKAVGDG